MRENTVSDSKCPYTGGTATNEGTYNRDWWSAQLNLAVLHHNSPMSDPMGENFDYAAEFKTLDLAALKRDIEELMATSRGASRLWSLRAVLFVWLGIVGTYRTADGRGGAGAECNFAPLNSWPTM